MRPRIATVWLAGCSGCHMSLLDMDERLLDLAGQMDLVYSPLMDIKEFPDDVDIALVEGAVANADNARMLRLVRARSAVLARERIRRPGGPYETTRAGGISTASRFARRGPSDV